MTGFYGKLPLHGDFVSRGLKPGVKRALDQLLAKLATADLPEDGLRASLCFENQMWLALILPSFDAPGRFFPLAVMVPFVDKSFQRAELRCKDLSSIAQSATSGAWDADELLVELPIVEFGAEMPEVPEAVWTSSTPPTPLAQILSDINSD
ncbi:TagF domain-containing protein [uncultured Tateyamaria sp.]|uniref:TagF domain-containing protein n=1 Tax=uncultured Tateyamaria sp. TaxID=455651 RepID=UPI00261D79AC|nr:TagF domain-containing protein [uncultured Tateyamaria sp.]